MAQNNQQRLADSIDSYVSQNTISVDQYYLNQISSVLRVLQNTTSRNLFVRLLYKLHSFLIKSEMSDDRYNLLGSLETQKQQLIRNFLFNISGINVKNSLTTSELAVFENHLYFIYNWVEELHKIRTEFYFQRTADITLNRQLVDLINLMRIVLYLVDLNYIEKLTANNNPVLFDSSEYWFLEKISQVNETANETQAPKPGKPSKPHQPTIYDPDYPNWIKKQKEMEQLAKSQTRSAQEVIDRAKRNAEEIRNNRNR